MKYLAAIPCYQRPKALRMCIETLFNTNRPSETWFFDDGSDFALRQGLVNLQIEHSTPESPINLFLWGQNMGIGYNFEMVYQVLKARDPDLFALVESDYIFRKNFVKDIEAVFEACPYTVVISMVSHPDMYDNYKCFTLFPQLMKEIYNEDIEARKYMYKPFTIETKRGPIKIQAISNTCGCHFLNWKRVKEFIFSTKEGEEEFWKLMNRAFNNGPGLDKTRASDQHISGLSYLWEKWAKANNIDISKHFGFVDICDFSCSEHLCSKGVNGHLPGYEECTTFVHSPVWDSKYIQIDPRENL